LDGMREREIDLDTGEPMKKPLDYKKWDAIATRVCAEDENGSIAAYTWEERTHGELCVRIPILGKTRSKQVRVDIKRNWLTVFAPPPEAVVGSFPENAPPKEPVLDFQLYGAVDPDESDWELVDDGALRTIILTLKRSPVYKWPTLHRVNGLKSEAERAPKLAEQKAKWEAEQEKLRKQAQEEEQAAVAAAASDRNVASFEQAAGPPRPPAFGPEEAPKRRPRRPKGRDSGPLPPEHDHEAGPTSMPPGAHEGGRVIVTEPEYTDSSDEG
jgi:hypothetical protein